MWTQGIHKAGCHPHPNPTPGSHHGSSIEMHEEAAQQSQGAQMHEPVIDDMKGTLWTPVRKRRNIFSPSTLVADDTRIFVFSTTNPSSVSHNLKRQRKRELGETPTHQSGFPFNITSFRKLVRQIHPHWLPLARPFSLFPEWSVLFTKQPSPLNPQLQYTPQQYTPQHFVGTYSCAPVIMYTCEGWTVKKAEAEELMLLNCGAGEDSWESLGLPGEQTSPGNQPWILIGRTDAKTEAPIPYVKNWLIRKDPDAGKDCGQKEKVAAENVMAWWHHQLNGHELGQLQEIVRDQEAWHAAVHGVTKSPIWLSDWTTTTSVFNDWWSTEGPMTQKWRQ